MRPALLLITLADAALALLLLAVSGYVLEGVNNTGPMMPEALLFAAMLLACIACPALAWALRARLDPGMGIAIAAAPLAVAAIVTMAGP